MTAITLAAGTATAEIALQGGELTHWSVGGRALLWTPDGRWWTQTCPILFPVIGAINGNVIRVKDRTYPCAVHGFAAQTRFAVIERSASAATLELAADARTRAVFPFGFRLRARFQLDHRSLRVDLTVENDGDVPLPYALGLHPGFRWPFAAGAKQEYDVVFERPEAPEVPLHDADRLITTRRRTVKLDGRTLALSDALFEPGGVVFLNASSRSMAFCAPDGGAIDVAVEDMPHLVLWTRPGAPFLCLEGWTGHADPAGFTGDIAEKPSMRLLEPGSSTHHAMTFSYRIGPAADQGQP